MDQQHIIETMEARAKALGRSISSICEEAGVHPTTFSRWKRSDRNAEPVGASLRSLSAIDGVLSRVEAERVKECALCERPAADAHACAALDCAHRAEAAA